MQKAWFHTVPAPPINTQGEPKVQDPKRGRKILTVARTPSCIALAAALSIPCAAQQPATPPPPTPPSHPNHDATKSLALSPQEAHKALQATEAAHPGNTPELAEALIQVVYAELMASTTTQDTLATAERAEQVAAAAQGKDSSLYAVAVAARARLLLIMDHPELARPLAEEAVAIEQREGSNPEGMADATNTLTGICQRAGDKACALRSADLEVKTLRAFKDPDPLRMASALLDLMLARRMNADMPGAKIAADEAMAIADRAETAAPDWLPIETTTGSFYLADGDFQLALLHLKRSLDLNIKLNGPDNVTQSGVNANLAYLEMCLGHTSQALDYYAKARDLYRRRYGPGYSQTLRIEAGYGYALSCLGRTKEAVDLEVASHTMLREHIRLAIQLMPEQQALAMANTGTESYYLGLSIATQHPEIGGAQVYQELIRSRALVAEEMAQRQAALNRKHDPAVETLEQELEKESKAVMDLQAAPQSASNALADATSKMENTERQLAQRSSAYRANERAQTAELSDLRKNMPPGSVMVSYVAFPKYWEEAANFNKAPIPTYTAFVLRRDSEQIGVYDLGDAHQINDLVRKMRASADAEAQSGGMGSVRNEREYREAGLDLRKRIWDPLKSDVENAKLVLVVPDGILNLVPFSSLPSGDGYLVEHGPVVHILSSERDLLPAANKEKKTGLLAIGSPAFELAEASPANPSVTHPQSLRGGDLGDSAGSADSINCDQFTKMEFRPLPGSLDEVKEISSTFKQWNSKEPERLLTGENATRSRFIEAAPQSRILHIATHAFVLDKTCGNGNPLLHSGLVFAGANKARNASLLTAQQIASLDLSGVDWAVLSACDTGTGELKDGEGVLGLQRSFRVAGAKSVVMALWPVDDTATRMYMHELYAQRFGRHASTADAAWIASRKMLLQRRAAQQATHPWHWAGFVSSGGWQ